MKSYFYDLRYDVDNVEWRARAKRALIFQFWKQYKENSQKTKMLDLGCGTGVLQEQFERRFNIEAFGIDTSKEAIRYCKKRGLKRTKIFTGKRIPFRDESFNLVTAIDVVEHIKDDMATLKEIKRVLKRKGIAIILVPAHMRLWSTRDINLQHFRRYEVGELEKKCKALGFKLLKSKNVDFAIYFIFLLIHSLAPQKKRVKQLKMDTASTNRILNEIMFGYELVENKLQNFLTFPIGLSIAIVVQKV